MVIELSRLQFGLKPYAWFEITSMISDQNCTTRGSIATLFHPFWNSLNTGLGQFKYFIDAVLSRFEIKFINFWGKNKSFGDKSCKICHMILFVFHFSCNLIGFFKQALKSASSLAGEKIRFKAKMVRFVNKSHQLELVRLQGPPVISKWV